MNRNFCSELGILSMLNFTEDIYSTTTVVTSTIFLSSLVAFIVVTNIVVIISIFHSMWTDRHRNGKMYISKILMASMAVADMFIAAFPMSLDIHKNILNGTRYIGYNACVLRMVSDVFLCSVSVYHVMFMAVDRYLAVCRPLTYRKLSETSAYLMVFICWTVPACAMFIPMIFGLHTFGVEKINECARIIELCVYKFNPTYQIFLATTSLYMTLGIAICLYASVLRTVHGFHKRKTHFGIKLTNNLAYDFSDKSRSKNEEAKPFRKVSQTSNELAEYSDRLRLHEFAAETQPGINQSFCCGESSTSLALESLHQMGDSRVMQEIESSTREQMMFSLLDDEEKVNTDDLRKNYPSYSSSIFSISIQQIEPVLLQQGLPLPQSSLTSDQQSSCSIQEIPGKFDAEHLKNNYILQSTSSFLTTDQLKSCSTSHQQSKSDTRKVLKMLSKVTITHDTRSQELQEENITNLRCPTQHIISNKESNLYTRHTHLDHSYDTSSKTESHTPHTTSPPNFADKKDKKIDTHFPKSINTDASNKTSIKQNVKAIRTIGIIIICFVICWLPWGIIIVLMEVENVLMPQWSIMFIGWLSFSNSALNPIVYCSNQSIRAAVISLLCLFHRNR